MDKHNTGQKPKSLNRRKAIRLRCLDCSGGHQSEVENCLFLECPLFSFRIVKTKQNSQARSKAVKDYCRWCCNDQLREVSRCISYNCPLFGFGHQKGKDIRTSQEDKIVLDALLIRRIVGLSG